MHPECGIPFSEKFVTALHTICCKLYGPRWQISLKLDNRCDNFIASSISRLLTSTPEFEDLTTPTPIQNSVNKTDSCFYFSKFQRYLPFIKQWNAEGKQLPVVLFWGGMIFDLSLTRWNRYHCTLWLGPWFGQFPFQECKLPSLPLCWIWINSHHSISFGS